ncbi:hypothetical protein NX026_28380 [Klebsiella pneumoniae]|jgi:hypothetical protein|nr:hypothetical protein [Klebsiella pneumoniae]
MTTATMATPAKAKNENVSLRTFLEKMVSVVVWAMVLLWTRRI